MATEIFRCTKDRSKKSSFEFYAQKKLNRRKITNAENYAKSAKTNKISSRKLNKDAIWKRKQRQRIKEKECKENVNKEKQKMYTRRAREKKRLDKTMNEETCLKNFKHRMEKSRAMKTLKLSLPETPNRRVSLLQSYLKMNSPTIKTLEKMKIVRSPDDEVVNNVAENAMKDMRAVLDSTKQQRSSESNLARKLLFAAVCGEVVGGNKCKVKLAKQLGVKRGKIAAAGRTRTRILKSSTSCWKLAEKKNRKNHISHESKKLAYDFWLRSGMSRPTGNKKDIKRERLEPHVFISHMIHVLEKSQTEVYNDFRLAYPDIHMSQRSFERLKPFFVRAVRTNDRNTCLCRYHVEFKTVFEHCMRARRNILVSHADPSKKDTYTIFQSINEIISCTLCAKEDFSDHYDISCLNRTCSTCGVKGFQQMAEEKSEEIVEWERFEYVSIATKGNQTRKKLMLVVLPSCLHTSLNYYQYSQHISSGPYGKTSNSKH